MTTWRLAIYDSDLHSPEYVVALARRLDDDCSQEDAEELAKHLQAVGKVALPVQDGAAARRASELVLAAGPDPARPACRTSLIVGLELEDECGVRPLERLRRGPDGLELVGHEELERLLLDERYARNDPLGAARRVRLEPPRSSLHRWVVLASCLPALYGGAIMTQFRSDLPPLLRTNTGQPGLPEILLMGLAVLAPIIGLAWLASSGPEVVEVNEHALWFPEDSLRVPWASVVGFRDADGDVVELVLASQRHARRAPTPNEGQRVLLLELLDAHGIPRLE